jgi:hypothetical protein
VAGVPEVDAPAALHRNTGRQGHQDPRRFDDAVTRAKPRRELEERENGETPRTRGRRADVPEAELTASN